MQDYRRSELRNKRSCSACTQQEKNKQQEKQDEMLTAQVYLLTTALQHSSFKYHPCDPSSVFLPPHVFTMTNFMQHKMDDDRWFSPPFYSHIGGYKMCISVDANGSDIGRNTHVSLFFHIVPGEYDDTLRWPFHGEVTVQLLNQTKNADHLEKPLVEAIDCSDNSIMYFARVQEVKQHGHGWGYPKFITHGGLAYNAGKDCQYLKNDCLKFQVNKVVVFDKL